MKIPKRPELSIIIMTLIGSAAFILFVLLLFILVDHPIGNDTTTVSGLVIALAFGVVCGIAVGSRIRRLNLTLQILTGRINELRSQVESLTLKRQETTVIPAPATAHINHETENQNFLEYYENEWRRALRSNKPITLILCGLDQSNQQDTLSADFEKCVEVVTGFLEEVTKRPADLVYRQNSNEILLLLPDTSLEGASKFAEIIRSQIVAMEPKNGEKCVCDQVIISMGVASGVPNRTADSEELLNAARISLQNSRENGFIVISTPFTE